LTTKSQDDIYIYIYIEREREREREMIRYWIDPGQPRLTCKISTQVMRPAKKIIESKSKKYSRLILNQPIVEE
jgi:hypothetical protein